ncbi:unnamed protein product, partial [Amoebophrya sp. A25]
RPFGVFRVPPHLIYSPTEYDLKNEYNTNTEDAEKETNLRSDEGNSKVKSSPSTEATPKYSSKAWSDAWHAANLSSDLASSSIIVRCPSAYLGSAIVVRRAGPRVYHSHNTNMRMQNPAE